MVAVLTLRMHLPISYVMDEMEVYEARGLMQYEYYANKDNWEQARMIAYLIAQTNSKRRLSFTDITKFYWENETTSEADKTISKADIERLKNKAEAYLKSTR